MENQPALSLPMALPTACPQPAYGPAHSPAYGPAHSPALYWHFHFQPELGNNLDAFQWKNGERKCDTYTVEYYLGVKNNDLMKFADKWMEPETIILREENEGIQVRNLKNTGQMRYLKKKAKSSRRFVPRKRFSAVSHDHTE
ncbi:hypothetical protein STEG23_021156 [Scotinomys teguina]